MYMRIGICMFIYIYTYIHRERCCLFHWIKHPHVAYCISYMTSGGYIRLYKICLHIERGCVQNTVFTCLFIILTTWSLLIRWVYTKNIYVYMYIRIHCRLYLFTYISIVYAVLRYIYIYIYIHYLLTWSYRIS